MLNVECRSYLLSEIAKLFFAFFSCCAYTVWVYLQQCLVLRCECTHHFYLSLFFFLSSLFLLLWLLLLESFHSICKARTKVFRIKNDVFEQIKLRKNDTVSFIPWFRMDVKIQLNYRRLYFAATCYLPFCRRWEQRGTKRNKKYSIKWNTTARNSSVRCQDSDWKRFAQMNHIESHRIASLDISHSVNGFCEAEQSTSAQIFFISLLACSFARSFLIRLMRVFLAVLLNVRNAIVSMFDFFMCSERQANAFLAPFATQLLVSKRAWK